MADQPKVPQQTPPPAPRQGDPCVMVIFGASGDLTKRKLIPALYNLAKDHLLSDHFAVIGFAKDDFSTDQFRQKLRDEIAQFADETIDPAIFESLVSRVEFMNGDFADPGSYARLKEMLEKAEKDFGIAPNRFYYLATAPLFFSTIVRQLGAAGLTEESAGWRRVVIEKPFGRDHDSARQLNKEIREVLNEKQIYRIDHYLGKETVQNIMVFRFANGIFEPIWNRRYVDHVQITVAETVGVEQRGGYYDSAGTLRDMIPNHIFQLICLTAMEPPVSFDADAVRDEQAKILKALQPLSPEDVLARTVRGQYEGYRAEPNVSPASRTETFVAMKFFIDNWRWADVPFYVRTGKKMPARVTEIAIQFRRAPFVLFRKTSVEGLHPNRLVLHLQPDEGISLSFGAKIPGTVVRMGDVNMEFHYEDYFGTTPSTGYERLLYDCMLGDATLFQRSDMVETAWGVVAPIQDVWEALPPRSFPNYAEGTWGPKEADELLARDGRHWSTCDVNSPAKPDA
ncbi:MAG TPA: glucose-6-phosphate dehydrogenase [Bryobacteraceae bacterium]|jgi:glucose-6-phosphate 1-dehydrogenase|nr:glucose-6-phosphate dehydrogenase [Bryobacteraceae bacterium]